MPTTNGHLPVFNAAQAVDFIANAVLSRQSLLNRGIDGENRNLDRDCGYPEGVIQPQQYRAIYDREGIGARLVGIYPKECWKVEPYVYETEDEKRETVFEGALKELGRSLDGESWLASQEQTGNAIFHYLARIDELSGIGSFGVLLLGLGDGRDLSEPADGIDQRGRKVGNAKNELLYLRTLDQSLVEIDEFENDKISPRYGQPIYYNLTLTDPNSTNGIRGMDQTSAKVHWSRVVHVADNCQSSEVFGVPRMQRLFNRLLDLRKILGSSGEMFWRGAFPGLGLEMDPVAAAAAGIDVNSTEWLEAARESIANYVNGLDRFLALLGIKIKSIETQVADPTNHIEAQLKAICIADAIPLRIFVGNELGLRSSEDDREGWNGRLSERCNRYLTPRVIGRTINRFICLGVLPTPKEYFCNWPEFGTPSEQDRANVAKTVIEALAKYVAAGVDNVFPLLEALTKIFGYTQEEAEAIVKAAEEQAAELEAEQEELDAQIEKELAARGMGQPGGMNSFPTKDAPP